MLLGAAWAGEKSKETEQKGSPAAAQRRLCCRAVQLAGGGPAAVRCAREEEAERAERKGCKEKEARVSGERVAAGRRPFYLREIHAEPSDRDQRPGFAGPELA